MTDRPPVFILSRDRLGCLRRLVDLLRERWDISPIVIDNASTYPPLVDYLASADVAHVRLPTNYGHRAIWDLGVLDAFGIDTPYVVTDPDVLPADDCPADLFEHLGELLAEYPNVAKVGLSLRIDDLPDHYPHKQTVIDWETPFWQNELRPGVFDAPVDTTFALYRPSAREYCLEPALRTDVPYVAHHLSWYLDEASMAADERYYRAHADTEVTNWVKRELPDWLATGSGHPLGHEAVKPRSNDVASGGVSAREATPSVDDAGSALSSEVSAS
jgi:hypothetical protein